ncbi:hypothetical protein Taro_054068 [Colocasia esculenta]|uniref:Uncharacterized protein n=1 Tax=Colocasia esculenta TaxID=4460 RepID=A0A843XQ29_COLES|nr:hypothetical protein [Colocasia esculenta]
MLLKLNKLKMPLSWDHITKIAGNGVAPGRVHVARAMVEAGFVENLKQAFSRYLYDGGPAYATGSELPAEEAVQLICHTGGVAALAHPWALKNPIPIIRSLKAAGLHAMEVYRGDGKMAVFSDLADAHELLKIGGSDFHGRCSGDESNIGVVNLPVVAVYEFLTFARPIWLNSIKDVLTTFAEAPSYGNLERILKFCRLKSKEDGALIRGRDLVDFYLAAWLTDEERQSTELEDLKLKLSSIVLNKGLEVTVPS